MNKSLSGELVKASSTKYDATFIISSTALDRDRDTFTAKALEKVAKSTKKLICLWSHKQDAPVGFWENLKFDGKQLTADVKIAGTNLGKMIKQLLADEVPLASSVGFAAKDYDANDHGGYEFKDVDMYECSIVSTPANPQAQRIKQVAKQFGVELNELSEPSECSDNDGVSAESTNQDAIQNAKSAILGANKLLRSIG